MNIPLHLKPLKYDSEFFDPYKACGSHSRTKLGYQRKMLVNIAKANNIPGATSLSLDALCLLLKEIYWENVKKKTFLKYISLNKKIPIPCEIPFLAGTLTIQNAKALLEEKEILKILREQVTMISSNENLNFEKQIELVIFTQIFFPDLFVDLKTKFNLDNYDSKYGNITNDFIQMLKKK